MAGSPEEVASGRPATPIGVVLAGGGSRRLGRDKTRLVIDGLTLPGRAAERLREACASIVVADAGRRLLADVDSVADGPAAGPAGGILGAAARFPGRSLLVLACDLPNVPAALLIDLAGAGEHCDWAVPRWRRGIEPLCALYGTAALEHLARLTASGSPALHRLTGVTELRIHWLEQQALEAHGSPADLFLNVNTPEDLCRLHTTR